MDKRKKYFACTALISREQIENIVDSACTVSWCYAERWNAKTFSRDSSRLVIYEQPDTGKEVKQIVTLQRFVNAIGPLISTHAYTAKGIFDANHTDGYTFDSILQFAIFGELKY